MFQGFCPETIDFLWGIRMNNNREWFTPHKQQYITTLYEPMKALGQELFQPFSDRPDTVLKVSRIYRDARMHHDEPYKESLWICIRPQVQWWGENPCLYFELNPDEAHYGLFWWQPRSVTMEEFRKRIRATPQEFCRLIDDTQKKTGQPITAECYRRPKATEPTELYPYLQWRRQIGCVRQEPIGENLFQPQLGQRVATFFQQLTPLYDYLNQFKV